MKYSASIISLIITITLINCSSNFRMNRNISYGVKPDEDLPLKDVPVRGFETSVDYICYSGSYRRGTDRCFITGELIAVDTKYIYIMDGKITIPILKKVIRKIEIEIHSSNVWGLMGWTLAGIVSTVTHGALMVITAPTWLIAGIANSVSASKTNDIRLSDPENKYLYQYARFPQGLPQNWPVNWKKTN
jgi:hypothetical protein